MKPQLQALLLAERIYQSSDGKKVIDGTFNRILISPPPDSPRQTKGTSRGQVPAIQERESPGSPYAYISLTDVCDGTTLGFQVVSLSSNKRILGTSLEIEKADRLETVELILPLPELKITEPGFYSIDVLWEGEILGSHRIRVDQMDDDHGPD